MISVVLENESTENESMAGKRPCQAAIMDMYNNAMSYCTVELSLCRCCTKVLIAHLILSRWILH